MPIYDPNPGIIEVSYAELLKIASWLAEHEKNPDAPKVVLIGGWAVDAYNPYLGSVDIDLVTNSRMKQRLMYYLQTREGYQYHVQFPFGKTVYKEIPPHGQVILDFETREISHPFEGYSQLPFQLDILDGNTVMKPIRGRSAMALPNRATLLFLKMKAAWDRGYRISNSIPLLSKEWEVGKRIKDYADILALIDPVAGGQEIDLEVLGALISQYTFLKSFIIDIPEIPEIDAVVRRYERMDIKTIRSVCSTLDSIL
jgi:hypothetical protein